MPYWVGTFLNRFLDLAGWQAAAALLILIGLAGGIFMLLRERWRREADSAEKAQAAGLEVTRLEAEGEAEEKKGLLTELKEYRTLIGNHLGHSEVVLSSIRDDYSRTSAKTIEALNSISKACENGFAQTSKEHESSESAHATIKEGLSQIKGFIQGQR